MVSRRIIIAGRRAPRRRRLEVAVVSLRRMMRCVRFVYAANRWYYESGLEGRSEVVCDRFLVLQGAPEGVQRDVDVCVLQQDVCLPGMQGSSSDFLQ